MRVQELWLYPVKSLQGERLEDVVAGAFGLDGDRTHALVEVANGRVLSAVRDPQLLLAEGRRRADGGIQVVLPGGRVATTDEELSTWLGRPVRLEEAWGRTRPFAPGGSAAPPTRWDGPSGSFHDFHTARISIIGMGTVRALGDWDVRRFRANIVLDGEGEDGLVGRRVRVGGALLDIQELLPRCVLVTRPQPGGIARDLDVLRTIRRERRGELAVGALVGEPGPIRLGDPVEVLA